ncbi:helicase-associated domain-containing protein [Isoptericola sp. 178]|uniref:helicase-associated domain-containing protein n=1 Tax=Isoptericola sp. 178 TaxID=3064651 RepID=UPI002712DBFB|nr:helicase-associated domain-containing protein [Isoptericola sp. 178]MDO8143920.1 helicase-associated domain-containing protein [Isoptericola sp. 178]
MAVTFTEWVRTRTDDELVTLLRARPDLGTPSPSTLRSLAARAASRTSTERAVAHLDAGTLQVLESLLALSDGGPPVGAARIAAALGAPDAVGPVARVLDDARDAALVWDDGDGVHPSPGLEEVLGPYPAGLGPARDGDGPTVDVAALSPAARQVLDALTWGPPVGVVPPEGSAARVAVDGLVTDGLLARSDTRHVLLPRDVGLALRGGRTHRTPDLDPPRPAGTVVPDATVDAEAAGAALEIVRQVAHVVVAWDDTPPSTLRAGGLAVRDLRRTARLLETDEATAATVVELAASAGLVADDGDAPASYVPTTRADGWEEAEDADRWATLATAWRRSRRTPWQVGTRDEKGTVRAPLSADLQRPWVPRLREQVLAVLAAQPGVALGVDDVLEVLRWRSPRAVPPEAAVAGLLREAALLGVTGAGVLSSPGRAVLAAGDDPGEEDLAEAMRTVFPEEVHEFLLQGDLTGIVPGRPGPELARLIDQAAEVESRGAATTVRFTTGSVTRALDHGRSGEDLLAEIAQRSAVPVPQPLEYLVKDTARRHEALRVGSAQSYVRTADPATLAGLADDPRLASLGLVRLAPTVLAASVPAAELHEVLRERGLLSALEGPDGRPLGRVRRGARLDRDAWSRRRGGGSVRGMTDAGRRELVARIRGTSRGGTSASAGSPDPGASPAGAEPGFGSVPGPGRGGNAASPFGEGVGVGRAVREPGDVQAELSEALRDGRTVWVELVGGSGALERRELRPMRLEGGRLRALDPVREAELTIAVHRIASVQPTD